MSTHAARISSSDRLQRVDALLADGREYSTLEIIQACEVCAVNSIIDELRANGRVIACRREKNRWLYRRADA
jgi:hypothetical protein